MSDDKYNARMQQLDHDVERFVELATGMPNGARTIDAVHMFGWTRTYAQTIGCRARYGRRLRATTGAPGYTFYYFPISSPPVES